MPWGDPRSIFFFLLFRWFPLDQTGLHCPALQCPSVQSGALRRRCWLDPWGRTADGHGTTGRPSTSGWRARRQTAVEHDRHQTDRMSPPPSPSLATRSGRGCTSGRAGSAANDAGVSKQLELTGAGWPTAVTAVFAAHATASLHPHTHSSRLHPIGIACRLHRHSAFHSLDTLPFDAPNEHPD